MKSIKKGILITVFIILGLLLFVGIIRLMRYCKTPMKGTVVQYVKEHKTELEVLANEDKPLLLEQEYLKSRLGSFTIVRSVCDHTYGRKDKVEFYCGGSGFVGGSSSYGFYYSSDDKPYGLEFNHHPLTETKPGVYEWQTDDLAQQLYTERICENWFYYFQNWD